MPKVSVIMPSLNVVPYIRECIDSVLCQTLEDIEILCVDAGSTDGTLEILEDYAAKDGRIKLIRSEKKSYGYQMNLGIQEAAGEYIGIVETDDFIVPEMYEELYRLAIDIDADFVKSNFDVFTTMEDGKRRYLTYVLSKYNNVKYHELFSSTDYVYSSVTIDVFIWNGIYKRSFLLNNQIRFQETPGAAFQDCGFRYQVALQVERGYFTDKSLYRYRRDNINASTYSNKSMLYNLAECRYLMEIIQQRHITDRERLFFLAREILLISYEPYREMLIWNHPVEGIIEAFNGFGDILKTFMKQGILTKESLPWLRWLEICLLIRSPAAYTEYMQVKVEIQREPFYEFLRQAAIQKQIILFGCGYVGACAYCYLRTHGVNNIVSFCDNDKRKWGAEYMGCQVISPEEIVKKYPGSCIMIANREHKDEIRSQLLGYGVAEEQIMIYNQTTYPLECISNFWEGDIE